MLWQLCRNHDRVAVVNFLLERFYRDGFSCCRFIGVEPLPPEHFSVVTFKESP